MNLMGWIDGYGLDLGLVAGLGRTGGLVSGVCAVEFLGIVPN